MTAPLSAAQAVPRSRTRFGAIGRRGRPVPMVAADVLSGPIVAASGDATIARMLWPKT
jgi:hypothetical protein